VLIIRRAIFVCVWVVMAGVLPISPADDSPSRLPVRARQSFWAAVSGASPFSPSCNGNQTGTNFVNGVVEPQMAVDPNNPQHLIGAWQQDRWSNGGASGVLTAVSLDGGKTWSNSSAPFSTCTGGTFERASDPWVTIGPDGTVYESALGINDTESLTAILVSSSKDGGFTWSPAATVIENGTEAVNDKESITADPVRAGYVYVVWDRGTGTNTYHAPVWFAISTDGGASWTPQVSFDPGVGSGTTSNEILVQPNGSLLDFFWLTLADESMDLATIRSTDGGHTWSAPTLISAFEPLDTTDLKTGQTVRGVLPSYAVDPNSGALYVAWEDGRFSNFVRNGIAFTKSTDGGMTWSTPVEVNQAPQVQAFEPTLAVAAHGAVAITYFDFRNDTSDPSVLLTNYWRITSLDGGNTWTEIPIAPAFNLLNAPLSPPYLFLGDYQAIAAAGEEFIEFFVAANSTSSIPTTVFATNTSARGDTRSNGHVEINPHPVRARMKMHLPKLRQ
jgi:hypothetical protein